MKYPYPHKHVRLVHGGMATVDKNCPQETIDALNALAEVVYHMEFPIKNSQNENKTTIPPR